MLKLVRSRPPDATWSPGPSAGAGAGGICGRVTQSGGGPSLRPRPFDFKFARLSSQTQD
jgi:hypothetical protein